MPDVIHHSRSQGEVDLRCRRERYWFTVFNGNGIIPAVEPLELRFGTVVHEAITTRYDHPLRAAEFAQVEMLSYLADPKVGATEEQKWEWPDLAAGLVYAYLSRVMPQVLTEWEPEKVEKLYVFKDEAGVEWSSRPDFLLRHREERDRRRYLELKTTSLDPSDFVRIFSRRLQGHHGALAAQQTLGVPVDEIQLQGLVKGGKYKGQLRSRLIGGYRRENALGKPAYRTDHAKGFEWFYAREYGDRGLRGIAQWIDQLPDALIAEMFPVTPPIVPNERKLQRFMRQRRFREMEIQEFRSDLDALADMMEIDGGPESVAQTLDYAMDRVFPQNEAACEDEITHRKCRYYDCCWNSAIGRDPLASGQYIPRPQFVEVLKRDAQKTD